MNYLLDSIEKHEAFRPHPYLDTKGIPTIGIGRAFPNLTLDQLQHLYPHGCTYEEAVGWMTAELPRYREDVRSLIKAFDGIDPVRQDVLVELCYNLGRKRLSGFLNMITNLNAEYYGDAAVELCDSKWWSDVKPRRALHLAYQLVSGQPWQLAFP